MPWWPLWGAQRGRSRLQNADAVAVYLDGGPANVGPASTVVRMTGPTPVLLREGAVPFTEILRVVGAAR